MTSKKDVAIAFLQQAASGHAREAFERYTTSAFRHHNAYFPGDATSLMIGMDDNARDNPGKRLEVQRALEEGDLVAVHSRVQHRPDDPGAAVVHVFRFEGELIAELWDVGQPVPAQLVNANGMF